MPPEGGEAITEVSRGRLAWLLGARDEALTRFNRATELAETSGDLFTLSVAGMSDESRCPSGDHEWTPEAPVAAIVVVGSNVETLESSDSEVVLEVVDPTSAPAEGFDLVGFASAFVSIDVEDHCTDASGARSEAWGASESLRDLSQVGIRICFGVVDSGYDEVDCGEGPTLAPTGGIRAR